LHWRAAGQVELLVKIPGIRVDRNNLQA
jgi:hypothetical protein